MLAVLGLSLTVVAQDNKTPAPVQIRAVLHDPVHPTAELFYTDKTGAGKMGSVWNGANLTGIWDISKRAFNASRSVLGKPELRNSNGRSAF